MGWGWERLRHSRPSPCRGEADGLGSMRAKLAFGDGNQGRFEPMVHLLWRLGGYHIKDGLTGDFQSKEAIGRSGWWWWIGWGFHRRVVVLMGTARFAHNRSRWSLSSADADRMGTPIPSASPRDGGTMGVLRCSYFSYHSLE